MSCNLYIHNDPSGGSKYISGTTCSGTEVYYYLNYGEEVCMNSNLPLINECGLEIGDSCFPVTPTPSTTPFDYCYYSGRTYSTADYECPATGEILYNVYGILTLSANLDGFLPSSSHPDLSFLLTNGTDFATVVIPDGQFTTEYVYPKVIYGGCQSLDCTPVNYPDWTIYTPATTQCNPYNPVCPEQLDFTYEGPFGEYLLFNGMYERAHVYSGGPFTSGYMNINSSTYEFTFVPGPDIGGLQTAVYIRFDGTYYYTMIPFAYDGGEIIAYAIYQTTTSYLYNGQTPLPYQVGLDYLDNCPEVGGIYYPRPGDNEPAGDEIKYIYYPLICPTPTPTPSVTPTQTPTVSLSQTPAPTCDVSYNVLETPTPTGTPTNTPTNTGTPTNTPTNTQTQTPTNTRTQTPTPSTTPVVYQYSTTFSGFTTLTDACLSGKTCERILYSADNPLTSSPRSVMYTDIGLTTPYNGGATNNRYALSLNCGGTWRAAYITTIGEIFTINTSC